MKYVNNAAVILMVAPLFGCFHSEEALMPEANKVQFYLSNSYISPTGDGSECYTSEMDREGSGHLMTRLIPVPFGNGAVERRPEHLSFDELFEDWYLVQAIAGLPESGMPNVSYHIAHRLELPQFPGRDSWLSFAGECTPEVGTMPGVAQSGEDCEFTSYASVEAAAKQQAQRLARLDYLEYANEVFIAESGAGQLQNSCVLIRALGN